MSCLGLQGVEMQLCRAADAAEQAAAAAQSLRDQRDAVGVLVAVADAVSTLLLPLLLLFALWRLWPVLRKIFETRKFTIKLAGFELSAQEATDQLRLQIEDLQKKLVDLEATGRAPVGPDDFFAPAPPEPVAPEGLPGTEPPAPTPPPSARRPASAARRIIWVDDEPEGNAALIAMFESEEIEVETVRSGREAVAWLWSDPDHFAAMITDQGRVEEGRYRSDAGTVLIRELRGGDIHVPIAVFTSARGVRMQKDALAAGAEIVTSSPMDLRAFVARYTGGPRADSLLA